MSEHVKGSDKLRPSSFFSSFTYVSLLLIGLLAASWGLITYDLKRTHEQVIREAHIQLRNLTGMYAEEVSSSIQALNYVLIDLREEWKSNPEEFSALVESRLAHLDPSVFNVGIINPEGKLVFSSADWRAPSVDLSDRDYFQFHLHNEGDELHIENPLLLRATHRLAVIASRPLPKQNGEFNGVITLAVSPEYFSRFHENIELGKGSTITLARVSGELIARSPRPGQVVDTTIENAPWLGARQNESGSFLGYSEIDNINRLYAWRVLEDGKLAVIMGQSMETILTPYHQLRRTYLAWGSAATLFILLVAYAIGRYRLQRAATTSAMQQMEGALARSQKLESIGRLTGGVAHDFNNILQIISSNIDLLGMTAAGNKQVEPHLNSMSHAIASGSKLASQLLTFARRQPLHPTTVSAGKLIKDIDSLIQRLVGDDIDVRTSIVDNVGNVEVDPALFENVFLNLAANARDAMNGKGTLSISLSNELIDENRMAAYHGITPGEYVSLAISDTGAGMSPEVMERVFEPFFTTKPEGKGIGLGLAMAYGFVKESGGHIHIDSEIGVGTTIRILLPRSSKGEEKSSSAPRRTMDAGTETILIVEDNAELRRMAGVMLGELGYRVLEAPTSQEALEIIKNDNSIDVLFTDVIMPGGMNGIELARKAKSIRPHLAVLMVSGSYEAHESLKGFHAENGNIAFLSKPYHIREVSTAIRKLLA